MTNFENCKNCPRVNVLELKHNNDIADIKANITAINKQLKQIAPFVEKEMEKSKAYQIVSTDLNTKITGIKFWIPILFGVIMVLYVIFNRK